MKFLIFDGYPELEYGISEKADGAMKFNSLKRESYLSAPYVLAHVVHGTRVAVAHADNRGGVLPETDGLVTKENNIFLVITVADCFPVYFYDPRTKTIGLIHAGWRGISQNIVKEAAKVLEKSGAGVKNLLAGIGPGIRECHFEVQEDVARLFGTKERFVNLSSIIQRRLIELGIKKSNIEDSGECTHCLGQKYFSYRRDKPAQVEAMIAYIGMKHD